MIKFHKKPLAILFDLGSTLIKHTDDTLAGNHYLFSISKNPRSIQFEQIQSFINRLSAELYPPAGAPLYEVNWITFNRLLLDAFGMQFPITLEQAEKEFFDHSTTWVPAPGIIELLNLLESLSIPAGILSNTVWSFDLVCKELNKIGLLKYFKFIMTSSEYGLRKPHPELFRVAAARFNISTEEIWFIGDNYILDVLGSRAVGMRSFQYTGITGRADGQPEETIDHWDSLRLILLTLSLNQDKPHVYIE